MNGEGGRVDGGCVVVDGECVVVFDGECVVVDVVLDVQIYVVL